MVKEIKYYQLGFLLFATMTFSTLYELFAIEYLSQTRAHPENQIFVQEKNLPKKKSEFQNENLKQISEVKFCFVEWFGGANEDQPEYIKGPDYDLAMAFLKKQKVKKIIPIKVNWPELFEKKPGLEERNSSYIPYLFEKKVCDFFAASIGVTPWRLTLMEIVPVYSGRTLVVTRNEFSKRIKKPGDLSGLRSAAVFGTSYYDWLMQQNLLLKNNGRPGIQITVKENLQTTKMLMNKEVDFILLDTTQAFYLLKLYPKELTLAFPASTNYRIGWGFRRGDPLKEKFEKFLISQKDIPNSSLEQVFLNSYPRYARAASGK